ncbi:MAG: AAA family ATPase [Alphaproteobacteria bacterium]|nr:AAA family ATPase [Alphaproteobacteria bacterium]
MAAGFNPKMIEEFQKGILARDIERVQKAIDAGVPPSTFINGHHPLELLLHVDYAADKMNMTAEQFHQRGAELVDLLLDHGVKLVEEEKYATTNCQYLADRFLISKRLADLSTVLIHAISQSLEENGFPYEPDTNGFVAHYLDYVGAKKGDDLKFHVTNALKQLESAHDTVRQRLTFPQAEEEKFIVREFHDRLDYWMHAFERPKLRSIFAELELGNPDNPWAAGPAKTDARPETKTKTKAADGEGMSQFVKILPKKQPQQVLAEMNELVGMSDAKGNALALVLRAQFDAARVATGLPNTTQALHTVFEGNPGTGKTTMARKRAELLHSLGLVGNRYVEISRENMVGQYIGHTEKNMVDLFNSADVVFIDEAYNLVGDKDDKKDFGNQVVNALMTALENRRDSLTVFFAGYPEEMRNFIASNPGLQSRITHYQSLQDYSGEELGQIMDDLLKKAGLKMEPEAREYAVEQLVFAKTAIGARDFGNARIVRTLVEQLPNKMAERLFGQTSGILEVEALSTVKKSDVEALNLAEKLGISVEPPRTLIGYKIKGLNR